MFKGNPFDPLNYLERQLRLRVNHSKDDRILVGGLSRLPEHRKEKAVWVVNNYKELLKMQLDAESNELDQQYDNIIGQLVNMIRESGKWIIC